MKATRLRITSLKFISAVDAGAQGPISNVALVKRAPSGDEYSLTAKVAKLDDALGVVFGYAVASTVDGGKSPHIDLQGDAVVGGDELIKVALGFAEAGAQSDVMHDCVTDGWVPFVMPLNADTKKAFQLAGDVEGIAIGMKPSAETFKRFQSGELGAFSIFGTGERTPLDEQKRAPTKVVKGALFTDEVDGHQHKICVYEDGSMSAEYATSAGAMQSHTHGVVFEGGVLTILADSGHSHQLAAGLAGVVAVPADAIVVVESGAAKARVTDENLATKIAARELAHAKSTRAAAMPHGGDMKIIVLTEAQHAHYSKLATADAEAFIAKTNVERDAVLADIAKADPVVHKTAAGVEIRKSHGELALMLAKQADESAAQIAKQAADIAKRDEAIEKSEVRKAAAELLKGMPGGDDTHDFIESCLRKGGDPVKAAAAREAIKGIVASSTIGKSAPGVNGTDPQEPSNEGDAMVALEKGLTTFAKAQGITKNVWTDGLAAFVKTTEGAALKRAVDESSAG